MQRVSFKGYALVFAILAGAGCSSASDEVPVMDEYYPEFPEMTSEAEERAAIGKVMGDMASALQSGDPDAVGAFFTPEVREAQVAWLRANPELMPDLAAPLQGAVMDALSDEYGWQENRYRSAEVSVEVDGMTFHVDLVKVGGQWLVGTI